MAIAKLRKDDVVVVLTGKDKGKTGAIIAINLKTGKVKVAGINMVHKCVKRKSQEDKGGIIKQEAFMNISNLAYWDNDKKQKISVGIKILESGEKVRFDKKSGEVIAEIRGAVS